jgi:hypothetical protein
MKYQLLDAWIIGAHYLPRGTILPNENADWNALARGRIPPIETLCLDQEAADKMFAAYHRDHWHRIHTGEGVKRKS